VCGFVFLLVGLGVFYFLLIIIGMVSIYVCGFACLFM